MIQEIIEGIKEDKSFNEESPLVICKSCMKLVPRTNLCLYCGAPILFKKNFTS